MTICIQGYSKNTIIHDNEVIIGLYRYSQEEKKQSRSAYALKDSIEPSTYNTRQE